MPLFSVSIQKLDEIGKPIDGHFAHSVLSEDQIKDSYVVEWLVGLAQSGVLKTKVDAKTTQSAQNTQSAHGTRVELRKAHNPYG